MTKFVLVQKEPESLDKDCIVISGPDFNADIELCSKKKPSSKMMTVNYLREIAATIGLKYAPETFNALTDVNVALYRGIPCTTLEETNEIVRKMFEKDYPAMFDYFVDYHLKRRPSGTKLIYFTGDLRYTSRFTQNGIDRVKEKELDVFLGKKEKKIIGKPIVKD